MMKGSILAGLVLGLCVTTAQAQNEQEPAKPRSAAQRQNQNVQPGKASPGLETPKQKASYGLGLNVGRSMLQAAMEVDVDAFITGMRDALAKKDPAIPPEELQEAMQQFQQEMTERAEATRKEQTQANLKEAQQFLAQNKQKQGVKATASGLQYQILKEGSGKSPDENDVVKVHYKGTLIDGTVFDSSLERGEPVQFPLNQVISGWTEGLQLMKTGGKARLFVPPDLAYGENPQPGSPIGPNDLLIFDVELLEVTEQPNKPADTRPAQPRQQTRPQQQQQ